MLAGGSCLSRVPRDTGLSVETLRPSGSPSALETAATFGPMWSLWPRGSRGTRRPHHIGDVSWLTLLSLEGHHFDRSACAGEALADRTALSVRDDNFGAVSHGLAPQLLTDGHALLTHAHAARLRLPDVEVPVDLSVHRAVVSRLVPLDCVVVLPFGTLGCGCVRTHRTTLPFRGLH